MLVFNCATDSLNVEIRPEAKKSMNQGIHSVAPVSGCRNAVG